MVDIKQRNSSAVLDFENKMKGHPLEDFNAFIGFPEIREQERKKYLLKEEVIKKYGGDNRLQSHEKIGWYFNSVEKKYINKRR